MERQSGRTTRHLTALAEYAAEGQRIAVLFPNDRHAHYAADLFHYIVRDGAKRAHSRYHFDFPGGGFVRIVTPGYRPDGLRLDKVAYDHSVWDRQDVHRARWLEQWVDYERYIEGRAVCSGNF